jgi:hypothetical protein
MRPSRLLPAIILLLACDLHVDNLDDVDVQDLRAHPTRAKIAAAATGLLAGARREIATRNGLVSTLGILGRESYNFDVSDARQVVELLEAPQLNPGNAAFGGAFWTDAYRNVRAASSLLGAIDTAPASVMNDADKAASRGFTLTLAALAYLQIIDTRDDNGAVIQTSADPRRLDPLVDKLTVFAHIDQLLDEGAASLQLGGATFPFPLGSGFAGFDTPATFLRANRAIAARARLYHGDHAGALIALGDSFISADPTGPRLDLGVYHAFGTGSGDQVDGLTDPNLLAHPSIEPEAEPRANGQPDLRVARKLRPVMARTLRMLTSDRAFTIYPNAREPVPIIRNEELILIRAEANIGTGQIAAAAADLNFIRTNSGGLAPRVDLTAGNITDELLRQRRYSLLFEGGHRWIDLRRNGRLADLPLDRPDHHIHAAFPIPLEETDARR